MQALWRIRMLGCLEAESDQETISRFRTRKVSLLLAYLAYFRDRSHSREELLEMLWPDLEPERAKPNLRQALASLRRNLEPSGVPAGAMLEAQHSVVKLNADYFETDVDAFRRHVQGASRSAEEAERAIALYNGDLLPGFFEDWVQTERLRLEDDYVATLQLGIRYAEQDGRLNDAIRYTHMSLAKDGFNEEMHARLIRLYLAAGRGSSAAGHLEEWRQTSESQLGVSPDPELERLVKGKGRPASTSEQPPRDRVISQPLFNPAPAEPQSVARLPIQLTRYFGRERERQYATDALRQRYTRILTLTGPAGTGKSRLSVETGRVLSQDSGWNVWFVPLADVSEGAGLMDAVLATIQAKGSGNDSFETLNDLLSEGNNLLILDNLEHIVDEAAPLVAEILAKVPSVFLLVTSRQALKIEGEHELDLGTLPVPEVESAAVSLTDLAAVPSVGLFVDRARAALPDFALTAHNAETIAEICRKLDGLPLALEIAAGLAGTLSPGQLLQNLDSRLELLRSRRRDLSLRHRSLRAAIDYSYNLLEDHLQKFFVNLSAFRGGFTIEAACEICQIDPAGSPRKRQAECLRHVLDLQERSLVKVEEAKDGAPTRFRLLESYREYAAELLSPDEELELRWRHANNYLRQGTDEVRSDDRDNRVAAVRFLHEQGVISECVALLLTFDSFSLVAQDVVRSLERSPDFEDFAPVDQNRILRLATDAHVHRSEFEQANRTICRAREIAERNGLVEERRLADRKLALVLAYQGRREESIALSEKNLEEGRLLGDLSAIEIAYGNIGTNHWCLRNLEAALLAYEGAYAASLELRNGRPYWPLLYNVSLANLDLGHLDEGLEQANEGLRIAQADDEAFGISMCLALVSRYHRYKGNLPSALAVNFESLVRRRKVGFLYWTFQAIFAHAATMAEMGLYAESATLLAATRTVTRVNDWEYNHACCRVRAAMTDADFDRAWAEGLGMGVEEAFRLATRFQ